LGFSLERFLVFCLKGAKTACKLLFVLFFERTTVDTEKVELVIFISAHVVDDEGLTTDQLEILEQNLGLRSASK